jgi:signal transduction histidine kinase
VLRHSEATEVFSTLEIRDNKLLLTIRDNGRGFVVEEITNKKTLGLLGMKERSSLMGGTYEITSNPGRGTSILIIVPLNTI